MIERTKNNSQRPRLPAIHWTALLSLVVMIGLPIRASGAETAVAGEDANAIRIPLRMGDQSDDARKGWKSIRFRGKPANNVSADKESLHIEVRHSVSLLVQCLSEPTKVHSVVVRGAVTGLPRIPEGKEQGDEKADDFAVRLGLAVSGTKKPGPAERLFAPEIVNRLCELAPDSKGIDHVQFLDLVNDPPPKWHERIHPLGKGLIREQIVCTKGEAGDFTLRAKFKEPLAVFALCICCDGDDTQSHYRVTITEIQLNPEEKEAGDKTNRK